jgi:hypothetical protein
MNPVGGTVILTSGWETFPMLPELIFLPGVTQPVHGLAGFSRGLPDLEPQPLRAVVFASLKPLLVTSAACWAGF